MKILINLMMFEFAQSATHLLNEPTREKVMKFRIDVYLGKCIFVSQWDGCIFSRLN